jgi:hypothetical protein
MTSALVSSPLVVSYGIGVDSTAILVGLHQRGVRPDLILFADVGAERQATYDYQPVINPWLRSIGFPEVTVVRYVPKDFKHWPAYRTIEENILTNVALPSIAYGGHSCSSKWKIAAQDAFLEAWAPALAAWAAGVRVRRLVGFEDSPHEHRRSLRCSTFAVQDLDGGRYTAEFPLQEWGWDRDRCAREIEAAGLPVPSKSSCYFCTAMKPWEVDELPADKLMRIVIIEARTRQRHIDYVIEKRAEWTAALAGTGPWPTPRKKSAPPFTRAKLLQRLADLPPDGTPIQQGIWRKAVKGCRGATPKPGSMTEYIRQQQLLPGPLIDALIRLTPTRYFTQADFEAMGVTDWQDWLNRLCEEAAMQALLELTKAS